MCHPHLGSVVRLVQHHDGHVLPGEACLVCFAGLHQRLQRARGGDNDHWQLLNRVARGWCAAAPVALAASHNHNLVSALEVPTQGLGLLLDERHCRG